MGDEQQAESNQRRAGNVHHLSDALDLTDSLLEDAMELQPRTNPWLASVLSSSALTILKAALNAAFEDDANKIRRGVA